MYTIYMYTSSMYTLSMYTLTTALRNHMRIVFVGYVVLDTFNNVYRDEYNILDQLYIEEICLNFYYDDF